jgi:hypothetical protein
MKVAVAESSCIDSPAWNFYGDCPKHLKRTNKTYLVDETYIR